MLYVPGDDVYLVSNINGAPLDKDGNGFISRLAPDGSVLDLKWIDGGAPGVALDAPKGMAIAGGVLYVADITELRMFDASSGEPMGSVEVPGSTFLNDVAAGARRRRVRHRLRARPAVPADRDRRHLPLPGRRAASRSSAAPSSIIPTA